MNVCRFETRTGEIHVGVAQGASCWIDLAPAGITTLESLLETGDPVGELRKFQFGKLPRFSPAEASLIAPIEQQEVWAAGVTYLRSKKARMDESQHSASAYDLVYEAERPELFFKSLPSKVVGPGRPVGIRRDARWSVPEPELALVINSRAQIVGYTVGNDMSSRDIEGANLLYLPQAKIYSHSCALGPWLAVGPSEKEARDWTIELQIRRKSQPVFSCNTSVSLIKRSFEELVSYLFRSQRFPHGAILLTGTGVVPPDTFTLQPGDLVEIAISGIGSLTSPVIEV